MKQYNNIDEYIATFPKEVRIKLNELRQKVKKAAPNAKEAIKYGIPTLVLNGNLIHFAGYKTHIGFYPGAKAIVIFKKELSSFELAKGTIRFPIDKKIPLSLIAKIVKFRVKEELKK